MTDPTVSLGIASILTAIFGYWISKRGDDTKRLSFMHDKLVLGYESRIKSLEEEIDELKQTLQETRDNEKQAIQNTIALLEEISALKARLSYMEDKFTPD